MDAFETGTPIAALDFESRIKNLASIISRPGTFHADAFVVVCQDGVGWEDIYYLSGFAGSSGALVVTEGGAKLFVDSRYVELAEETCACPCIPCLHDRGATPLGVAIDSLREASPGRVAVGGRNLTFSAYRAMSKAFGESGLVDMANVLMNMRRRKSEGEISCIINAVGIARRAFDAAVGEISVGASERELASQLEYAVHAFGGDFASIVPPMVVSGTRTSMPHAVPEWKKFEWGDLVLVDFCVRSGGYVCDITRMLSIGEPPKETSRLYSVVRWAQEEAAALIAPGVPVKEVDAAARGVMRSAGLEGFFTHGLGHGIGVSVHEMPSINQFSGARLSEGDVITLEPGFYKTGWFGMRVEDDYLVTDAGASNLSGAFDSSLLVVG